MICLYVASVHLKRHPSWEEEQRRSLWQSKGNIQSGVVGHMIPQQACLNRTSNQVHVDTQSVFSPWSSEVGQLALRRKKSLKETEHNASDKHAIVFVSTAKWDLNKP